MPFAVASQISPSGMTLAGKYGIGIISLGSMSTEGLTALPTQRASPSRSAKKHGTTVDRKNWRVLLNWHIAETREKAREEARHGLMRWHNEYIHGTLQRPGSVAYKSPNEAVEQISGEGSAAVIGTPDDLVKMIKSVLAQSGGFGTCVGFVHDWANPENTFRSWDMVARYVIPEINGYVTKLREVGEISPGKPRRLRRAPARPSWPRSWKTRTRPKPSRSPTTRASPPRARRFRRAWVSRQRNRPQSLTISSTRQPSGSADEQREAVAPLHRLLGRSQCRLAPSAAS